MSLFIWRKIQKKKKNDIGFTKSKGSIGKINNSFRILRNKPNIRISHSLKFPIKPNIGIFTFPGI